MRIAGTIRATYYKCGQGRNLEKNIKRNLGYEGVIEWETRRIGNSIVKNVLVAILGEMIPGKENAYKEAANVNRYKGD